MGLSPSHPHCLTPGVCTWRFLASLGQPHLVPLGRSSFQSAPRLLWNQKSHLPPVLGSTCAQSPVSPHMRGEEPSGGHEKGSSAGLAAGMLSDGHHSHPGPSSDP